MSTAKAQKMKSEEQIKFLREGAQEFQADFVSFLNDLEKDIQNYVIQRTGDKNAAITQLIIQLLLLHMLALNTLYFGYALDELDAAIESVLSNLERMLFDKGLHKIIKEELASINEEEQKCNGD